MTLFETYKAIETVANRHPNVNSVVDDFDKLNVETAKYSAIVIQEDIHSRTDDWMTYNFILGYVDRMVDWRGDDVEIHSVAVSALNTIIDTLKKSNQFADVTSTNYNIFTKRFDAMCAGAYCSLAISVPISSCTEIESFDTLVKRLTENGRYVYKAHGAPWDKVILDIAVQNPQAKYQVKSISVNENGHYDVIPDAEFDALTQVTLEVNVPTERKPEEVLTQTISENGIHTFSSPADKTYSSVVITADVHPNTRLEKEIHLNGEYEYIGDYRNASIVVDVPLKEEVVLSKEITQNGNYSYSPEVKGTVFSRADLTVDVHPNEALQRSYTENGIYNINGEWKDAEIAISVHPTEQLVQNIIANGEYNYDGEYSGVTLNINVPMKPEDTFTRTLVSNGTYTIEPTAEGHVFSGGSVIVAVPSDIHNQEKTALFISNTTTEITADEGYSGLSKVAIQVAVPDPVLQSKEVNPSLTAQTITADPGYDALGRVTVSGVTSDIDPNITAGNIKSGTTILGVTGTYDNRKPEETTSRTYTENGTYTIEPTSPNNVITEATVTVNVPNLTTMFSRLQSSEKVFYYDGDDGADYSEIIAALPDGWTAKAMHNLIVNITPNEATVNIETTN